MAVVCMFKPPDEDTENPWLYLPLLKHLETQTTTLRLQNLKKNQFNLCYDHGNSENRRQILQIQMERLIGTKIADSAIDAFYNHFL